MRLVYDNIIFSLQKAGGISVYWSELISGLKRKDITPLFFGYKKNQNIFFKGLNLESREENNVPISILRYLPFMKKISTGSIFHSSYYRISIQKDVKNVVTVHDFTYEHFGFGLSKIAHILQKRLAFKFASGIICVSENTKKDLLNFYPKIKKPIKVVYHGVGRGFFQLSEEDKVLSGKFKSLSEKKFVIFVGSRGGYKNFVQTVKTLGILKKYHLVIVGGGRLNLKEQKMIRKNLGEKYFYFENLDSIELNLLYNCAFCFFYPSLYEGFGIPILEAMRAGCPVVALNNSSIPEVAGEAGILVDRDDISMFAENIGRLEDFQVRDSYIKKGLEQSDKFSWEKCVEETISFYKSLGV